MLQVIGKNRQICNPRIRCDCLVIDRICINLIFRHQRDLSLSTFTSFNLWNLCWSTWINITVCPTLRDGSKTQVRSRKNIFRTPQEMEPSCQNDRLNQGFPFAVREWSDSKDWLGQFDRIEGSIRTSLWQYRRYFCCLKLLPYCSMCPMTQPSQIGIDRSCIWILVSFSMVYVSYQTDVNKT